jgi:hypothetical protein
MSYDLTRLPMKFRVPFRKVVTAALTGSAVFWLPFLLSSLFSHDWGFFSVLELIIGVPVLLCVAMEMMSDRLQISRRLTAIFMLAGVWVSGPFWITMENTLTPGQGLHMPGAWISLAAETLLFPFATFMMAAYHGSLGALLISVPVVVGVSLTNFRFRSPDGLARGRTSDSARPRPAA